MVEGGALRAEIAWAAGSQAFCGSSAPNAETLPRVRLRRYPSAAPIAREHRADHRLCL
jgi:hypothetical protein